MPGVLYTVDEKDRLSKCLEDRLSFDDVRALFPLRSPFSLAQVLNRLKKSDPERFNPTLVSKLLAGLYRERNRLRRKTLGKAYYYTPPQFNLIRVMSLSEKITVNLGYELKSVDLFGRSKLKICVAEQVSPTQFQRDLLDHVREAVIELRMSPRRISNVTYNYKAQNYVLRLSEDSDFLRMVYFYRLQKEVGFR